MVAVSSASGVEIDGYTAAGTPSHVKPSTQTNITIALTNKLTSPREADKAKIAIPPGFSIAAASVQASASAAGACIASTWGADGTLIAEGKINLKRPGGGSNTRLCPGATLTVQFSATSSSAEGTYVWATELFRDADTFVLTGPQPSVQVDGTAPTVTIGSHPPNPSNDPSPTFAFSANEEAALECKLDDGSFAACSSPKDYSALADGSHSFTVRATDGAGNVGTTSYSWLIETTLPVVTLTDKPNVTSKSSTASFSFTASKPVTSFECKLDEAAFTACASPASYSSLPDGPHTFAVKAIDAAANTGPETTYSWVVDTVAPIVTITQKPANPSNDTSPTFGFSSNEAGTFECKLDGAAFAACTSPKTYSAAAGPHSFAVKATDAAGNSSETSYEWTIDTSAPVATITQKPSNPSNVKSPTFAFSSSEAATFQCKLDAGVLMPCSSPKSYGDLADGVHKFTLSATDTAGNSGETSHEWTIDTSAPIATITQKPNDPSGVNSATFSFSAGEPATFQCKLDSAVFSPCASPKSYTNLPEGVRVFTVKATDAAGNTGVEVTHEWLVETVLPVVTLTATPSANSSAATFFFSANKPGATFECKLDGFDFTSCESPKGYAGLSDGPHVFAVRAKGTAGIGPETVHVWAIDTTGPTTAINEKPADPTSNRSASFAFTASESANFQCKLNDGAFAACSSPQTYGNLGEGRHTFVVRAIDALSNVGPETASAWTIETRAPATSITSAPPGLGNSTIASFSFSADEPATFQCNLDDRGYEPCSSPASYSGLREGGHAFAVRAIDTAGNVGVASHAWTVDATAPQTRIDSAPRRSTTATSATFALSSSEPATFQCRLDRAPFAPCGGLKTYKGLARGQHTFAVRGIDPAGNVDATPALSKWTIGRRITRRVATSALFAPALGARVSRPPLLRWRLVSSAKYYNVQLYRAGRKVLTAWPTRTRLQLRMRWTYNGRMESFKPGVYRWYVWPGFGRPAERRYGRLLGTSTFVVARAAPRG